MLSDVKFGGEARGPAQGLFLDPHLYKPSSGSTANSDQSNEGSIYNGHDLNGI